MYNGLPFISVIIPAFNNGSFIKFTLESLFNQTYPEENIEIIVVDDGSTDNTYEILKEYKEKIIYVYQQNKGIASARNLGIDMAKREIITFLDADDSWQKERLQRVVDTFREKKDIGMVYHPIELIDSDNVTICNNFYEAYGYKKGIRGWVTNEILSGRIFCGGSSFSFKKAIIEKFYPIPEDIRRGIDYYMSVISSCYAPVEYIPDILGKYRMHGKNITMQAGQDSHDELSVVNKDFAYMRQKVIEKILSLGNFKIKTIDINTIKRLRAKEIIFYNVLVGKRLEGIKHIPSLFNGNLSIWDLLKGIIVSLMALFLPASLYPKLIKVYDLIKRLGIVGF